MHDFDENASAGARPENRATVLADVLRKFFPRVRQGKGAMAHRVVVWDAYNGKEVSLVRSVARQWAGRCEVTTPGHYIIVEVL